MKNFPGDFKEIEEYEEIAIPQKALLIGSEMFGKIEIMSADGNFVLQADDYDYAKYLVYASRHKPCKIKIPVNRKELLLLLSEYEKYLDSIVVNLNSEYSKFFRVKNSDTAANEIFRALNLVRY